MTVSGGGSRQEGRDKLEPIEEVICEVADDFSGAVIEALTVRKGEVSIESSASAKLVIRTAAHCV